MMFIAMFKNFPMFFMQLWESFELGYTFGFWKGFSVFLSVWLFQWNSGTFWPFAFVQIEQTDEFFQSIEIQRFFQFIGFIFPYGMISIPFALFFHPHRTEFLEENGLYGTDFNKTYQMIFLYLLIAFILGTYCTLCWMKTVEDRERGPMKSREREASGSQEEEGEEEDESDSKDRDKDMD